MSLGPAQTAPKLPSGGQANRRRRCSAMPSILDDVLLHGQDSAVLEAAHSLLRTLTSSSEHSSTMESIEPLAEALDDLGFSGLWKHSSLPLAEDAKQTCFGLTEKLIEVRRSAVLFCYQGRRLIPHTRS